MRDQDAVKRCGSNLFPEYRSLLHRAPLKAMATPDQNTRVVIPVVFHVVGNSAVQNLLTEARMMEQIKQLNKDFSATNSDIGKVPAAFTPWVGDSAKVSFELKQVVRKSTSATSFKLGEICQDPIKFTSLGGSNSIDTAKNLNVWCGNIYDTDPYDLLGYATFPWYRSYGECYRNADGIVLHHETIGSMNSPNPGDGSGGWSKFNLGRTATHEIGHYLGFRHMWNDCLNPGSTDCGETTTCCRSVEDLPAQKGCNSGKPTFPHRSNSCPASQTSPSSSHGDMFMNYMDYVDDDTMNMFSESQLDIAMNMSIQYRPDMVRQFKSASTSTLSLSGLNSSKNSDLYQCLVINENGSVILGSDIVRVTSN